MKASGRRIFTIAPAHNTLYSLLLEDMYMLYFPLWAFVP
jgi:hypothetical protein